MLSEQDPVTLDLRQAVSHNGSQITGDGPVSVLTPPAQWDFAAAFRFTRAQLPESDSVRIRIEATILQGRIGFMVVPDTLTGCLGRDEERSSIDGDASIDLVIDHPPESAWIVIRNNSPGGVPSRCTIGSISVYAFTASPSEEWRPEDLEGNGAGLFHALRRKWSEVPLGLTGRRQTAELLKLGDEQLRALWTESHREATTGDGYLARGWYQELYRDVLRGKRVLDVGSGLGFDGITFARAGAKITFLDIVPSNLELVARLCRLFEVEPAAFHYLEDLSSLDQLPGDFDAIWCQGSMIHSPFEFARRESQSLLQHLRIGGRWIELAYPRERWQRDGSPPFAQWGKITDGGATPWAEWYDLRRLQERLHPAEFETVLSFNFCDRYFNWFDLIRRH